MCLLLIIVHSFAKPKGYSSFFRVPFPCFAVVGMYRRLRAAPSNTEQLAQWQLKLVQKLETMHNEAFQKRQPLITFIQELPAPKGQDALHDVAFALQLTGCQPDDAHQKAMDVLRPDSSHFTGSRDTCILQA